jgi:hypothetical protein
MRWNKIAVNARDCNAAELVSFVMESAREFSESDSAAPHRVLFSSAAIRPAAAACGARAS